MSKAILILDMPIDCGDCDMFYVDKDFWCYRCKANDEVIGDEIVRQKWCPLKRIPQKKYDGLNLFEWKKYKNEGWNECIDEILGEEE